MKRIAHTRLLAALLAWIMLLSLAAPAMAEDSAVASTMQLMKTTGTVSVTNNRGKDVKIFDKMRLYNGYRIATEEASYSWINLDSTKLVKEDACSELQIQKSGKKLDILVNSGTLYFNVTEPLDEDESLNIRTSTMSVGIRGTCGWVQVVNKWLVRVYLLEGKVEVSVTDPVTGQVKTAEITGGFMAECVVYPQDQAGDKCDILVRRFTEDDIRGFILVDLVYDEPLCEEIYEDSGLVIPPLRDEAEDRLKQDEEEMREKWEEIEEDLEEQENEVSEDPVWPENVPEETVQSPAPGPDLAPIAPAAPTERTMKITDDEAQEMLEGASAVRVLPNPAPTGLLDNVLEVDSGLTVPAGRSLALRPGIDVAVYNGQALRVDGTLNVEGGDVTVAGTNANVANTNGYLTVTSSNTLYVVGNLTNSGRMNVTASGRVVVDGTFTQSGTLTLTAGAKVLAKAFDLRVPVEGWRRSDTADADGYYTLVQETAVTASGMAGENVFWSYTEATKTLRIWGSGPMTDFNYDYFAGETNVPWYAYVSEIETLTIEDEVEHIGDYALSTCTALENVSLPDSLTSIGTGAFYGCYRLTGATIPDGVTSIGGYAFYGCSGLSHITIPDGVTSIEASAFYGCDGLTSITIPNSVTSIENGAFYLSGLTEVDLPAGLTCIGDYAFSGCNDLTSITIPDSVTSIGIAAFDNSGLTNINIPAGVTSIEENTFFGCSSLISVTIPNGVTSIGDYAFSGCNSLAALNIPDSVTSIGSYTFSNCYSLTSINIPDSVTSIGSNTFEWCNRLTQINIPAGVTSIEAATFTGCNDLTEINIPAGVTSIGNSAFSGCAHLTNINIPDSVTSIGDGAFAYSGLTEVNYIGTQAQWAEIEIGTDNDPLTNATIHCTDGDITSSTQAVSITSNSPAPGYEDVSPDAWYAEAVAYCREHGLMNGTSATRFSPDDTLTRAMMVTVLHRMAGEPAAAATASFRDVEAGQWYTEAVSWASGNGIVLGYGNGLFGTDDPVTHEQVALLLQRRSGDADVRVYGADKPQAPATRAEIAATLMDYVKEHPNMLREVSAMNVMCEPSGILAMEDGSLLVTDTYHKMIWRVTDGVSTVYAGGETVADPYGKPIGGYNDAAPEKSYFKEPWAVAPFRDGWAVSDAANGVVRLITPELTQTVNGRTGENLRLTALGVAFDRPTGLASDEKGNLYVADTDGGVIRKITPEEGEVTTVASGLAEPMGLCWWGGALYAAETGANRIIRIENGKVTVVAGGAEGYEDGPADRAAFCAPEGLTVGPDGTVYVADTGNNAVRQIRGGEVTTLAVREKFRADGYPISPRGLLVRENALYVCDNFGRKVLILALG